MLIISPIQHNIISSIKAEHFLEQFQSDLLLTQQLTMQDHGSYYLLFQKQTNDYTLYDGESNQTMFHRPLPKDWSYQMNTTRSPIRFNRNGTIRHPGTMRFYSPDRSYKVTFPFGISRATIE
ncbi:competence protein ComG [Halobacillus locisalis]|uniref:Competence protein ComG n=1 Tax=Halobacillus locisalis TaxID=220753 RepID=A0A838CNL0_9BACI|nr:competence protein ComG [Halobacillus locisalis]